MTARDVSRWSGSALLVVVLCASVAHAKWDSFHLGTGRDGPLIVTSASHTINAYAPVTEPLAPGTTTLSIGPVSGSGVLAMTATGGVGGSSNMTLAGPGGGGGGGLVLTFAPDNPGCTAAVRGAASGVQPDPVDAPHGAQPGSMGRVVSIAAPLAPFVVTPANASLHGNPRPTVAGSAQPGNTITVMIDGVPAGTTTSDFSGNWSLTPSRDLSDGLHTVTATAMDASGTVSPESTPHTFTVDTKAPDAVIVSGPPFVGTSRSATFDLDVKEADLGVTYECGLSPDTTFTACADPVTFTVSAEGTYTLVVRARDGVGNVGPETAPYTWTIELGSELPAPTITTPENGSLILEKSPTYSGTAGPGLEVIVEREDGSRVCTATADVMGDWSCVEPTLLADGPHTVLAVSGSALAPAGEPARTTFTVTTPVIPTPSTGGGGGGGPGTGSGEGPPRTPGDLFVYGRGCSSSGGAPWPWLVLLAVPLMHSRRSRPTARGSTLAAGLMTLAVLAAPRAGAQDSDPSLTSQAIDVQRYKPGPGATDILGVHGARVGQGWHLGASLNYASNTLGFFDARQDDFTYQVVATQLTLDLMGSISYCDRFELGVALPLTHQTSERGVAAPLAVAEGVTGAGLGDLRMVPKVRLVSTGGLHVGLAIPVLLPTSGGRAFRGGAGVAVQPQLLGEWATRGGLRLVANLGVHVRAEERLLTLHTGTEWMYALGARVPFGERLAVQAQLAGALGWRERDAEERPLELLGAVQYRVANGLRAHMGGGPGLTRGYGTPGFRVFAGFDWSPPEPAAR